MLNRIMITSTLLAIIALLAPATAESAQQMLAIRIHEFGGPEVLKLESAPRPAPGAGEMLVRVHAAGVNPIDWRIRAGPGLGTKLPYIPGFDVSGVVEEVGANVNKFKKSDEIFAMLDLRRGGAYAEYTIVKPEEAALKPAKMSQTDAASIPLVSLTAWEALFDTAKLDKRQIVLIHGGSGGVGSMAVQLAKWKGATVFATASQENQEFLKSLGADVTIDYRNQKFEEIAKNVDVVLDTIGGDTQARSWQTLAKGGILVSIVGGASRSKPKDLDVRAADILVHPSSDELSQIARLLDDGVIHPVVTQVLPLADAPKAHQMSETRHTRGKIVLEIAPAVAK
jgi:NADPH:quinone reductase-like Zn-dependent oxidoreductase